MIKNLNRPNFSPYGRVLGERLAGHGFPTGAQWITGLQRIGGNTDTLFRSSADVYMDFEDGMAILVVSRALEPEAIEAFYLDKPVLIQRGVYYCVVPFDEHCDVYMCTHQDAQIESVPLPSNGKAKIISASMGIPCIRTLFYQQKEGGFFFKGEAHRQYELTYMDKGSMHSIVGGQDYCLEPGEMMLYGPNQWHAQSSDGEDPVHFLTIAFDMECDYADILLNKKLQVDAHGAALLHCLLEESRQADILSGDLICCYLMQFLLGMIRHAYRGDRGVPLARPYATNSEKTVVDQALRYITANLYEKLSVAIVAGAVNVCASYLSVLFLRHLNTKPSDYIRREKIEESKLLIRQGEMNFTQIAERLKFSSVYHFSKMFKCLVGMTPSEFSRSIAPGDGVKKSLRKPTSEIEEIGT